MFKKFKSKFKAFITGKSGFSLVELIVVIAIMAVMAAVLAPSLLGYVERSRAQKDVSALDEVVNSVQLALADQDIYDEVLEHSVWDNVSCYIDKKNESEFTDCKISLKAANGDKKEQYTFGDEARLLDETVYYAAGNMRGLTITFSPLDSTETYDFSNGILNKFVGRNTGILSENPELYNGLRATIGDKLKITSQTYRNSDYTLFIRLGSTGGAEASQQDAVQVWGQFNGTNLAEKDHKYELSSGRVVGSAGSNDEANNTTNNNGSTSPNFSENAPVIKTMTINGTQYQYEDGITWEQWIESNNANFTLHDGYDRIWETDTTSLKYEAYFFDHEIDFTVASVDADAIAWTSYEVNKNEKIFPVSYFTESIGSLPRHSDLDLAMLSAGEQGYYFVDNDNGLSLYTTPPMKYMNIDGQQCGYVEGMKWSLWLNCRANRTGLYSDGSSIVNRNQKCLVYNEFEMSYFMSEDDYLELHTRVNPESPIFDINYTIVDFDCGVETIFESLSDLEPGTKYLYFNQNGTIELRIK